MSADAPGGASLQRSYRSVDIQHTAGGIRQPLGSPKPLRAGGADAVDMGRHGEGDGTPTPAALPGEIPWTEEPGGPRSLGSQRVGHD